MEANVDAAACSVPWGGLIVVLACIAIVALTYMSLSAVRVAKLQRWDDEWRQWQRHLRRVADDLGEAQQIAQHVAAVVGPPSRATATLVGSAATGALQPTSDVDVKVLVKRCDDFLAVAAAIQKSLRLRHVSSGGAFALFSGTLPRSGRALDVSVEMAPDSASASAAKTTTLATTASAPAAVRGFLEHLVRRRHPELTVRCSKHAAKPLAEM
jgi:hypothetical protein